MDTIVYDLEKIAVLPLFDPADYLNTQESVDAYLAEFADEKDPAVLAYANATVERARVKFSNKS